MKVIARFYMDCGRMGSVQSLFTCTKDELEDAYGRAFDFGEILGKHSEVYGHLEPDDVTILSEDQEFIKQFENVIGAGTVSGYNPLDYLLDNDDEEDE